LGEGTVVRLGDWDVLGDVLVAAVVLVDDVVRV
jgi:hypothetical protein